MLNISPFVILPATTFALGIWQVQRLNWKKRLIKRAEYALNTPPTSWENVREFIFEQDYDKFSKCADKNFLQGPKDKKEALELFLESVSPYRRILLSGEFLPTEILVGPRTLSSVLGRTSEGLSGPVEDGFLVFSPFQLDNSDPLLIERETKMLQLVKNTDPGLPRSAYAVEKERELEMEQQEFEKAKANGPAPKLVLVCRGWIPKNERDRAAERQIKGKVTIETIMTQSFAIPKTYSLNPIASLVVPRNDPTKNVWHSLNVSEMANYVSSVIKAKDAVEPTLFEIINSDFNANLVQSAKFAPVPKKPTVNLSDNHLSYAITW